MCQIGIQNIYSENVDKRCPLPSTWWVLSEDRPEESYVCCSRHLAEACARLERRSWDHARTSADHEWSEILVRRCPVWLDGEVEEKEKEKESKERSRRAVEAWIKQYSK